MRSISISANNIGDSDAVAIGDDITIDVTATKTLAITIGAFANTQTLTGNLDVPQNVDVSHPSGRYRERGCPSEVILRFQFSSFVVLRG